MGMEFLFLVGIAWLGSGSIGGLISGAASLGFTGAAHRAAMARIRVQRLAVLQMKNPPCGEHDGPKFGG